MLVSGSASTLRDVTARRPNLIACTTALYLLGAVGLSSVANAAPEWEGDFETGDFSQWVLHPSNFGNQDGVTVVQDVVHEGDYAARVELAPGDVAPGGLTRNELEYSPDPDTFEGSERYYAIALRAGEEPFANDWHSLWYWEGNPVFSPVMSLNATGAQFQFRTILGTDQELWTAPFTPGQWHEFVLHVLWSADPAVGFVELYYDGEVVVPVTGAQTMHGPQVPNFMHAGMLRSENIGVTEVLYIDAVRSGATLQDVMPGADGGSDGGSDTSGDSDDDPSDDGNPGDDGDGTTGSSDAGPGDGADSEPDGGASDGTTGGTAGNDGGSDGSSAGSDDDDGGCSCRSSPAAPAPVWLGLGLLAFTRRRRG